MDLSDFKKHDKKILKGNKNKNESEPFLSKKAKVGRPKDVIVKKRINLYLPEDLLGVIDENCEGNRSYFAIKVFKHYFDQHKIKY